MARCIRCRQFILAGGVREGADRFCNQHCYQRSLLERAHQLISDEELDERLLDVHGGRCSLCQGPGPVDFHATYMRWSILVVSYGTGEYLLACRRCARARQRRDLLTTSLVGWWSLHGLLLTPIDIIRQLRAMSDAPPPEIPSQLLEEHVRMVMCQERIAGAAEPGQHSTSAPGTLWPVADERGS